MPQKMKLSDEVLSGKPQGAVDPAYYPAIPSTQNFEIHAPGTPLSHYLWILRLHLWKIVAFVAVCMLVTFVISARLKPIYESTATIDVDMQAPSEIVGQGSLPSTYAYDADQILATNMRLIQTDAVLRPVAEQFHLLDNDGKNSSLPPGQAQIAHLAPVGIGGLQITRPPNTYLLLISYRSTDPRLAADVANAVANSYLAHTYNIRIQSSASLSAFMEKQIDELKAKMERSSLALAQFEKELGVVSPEAKTDILSARLMQLNTEYAAAQAERIGKEAAWNASESGSLQAAEASSQGQSLTKLNDGLNQAQQRLAEVKSTYGINHPEYRKAASAQAEVENEIESTRRNISERIGVEYRQSLNREQLLQKAVAETKAEWDQLNARSFEYQQLKQGADADKSLYDELIKKIRESDINAGFKDNDIRIVDFARPSLAPIFPKTKQNLLMAFLLATLVAFGSAVLLDSLDTTLRDPDEAHRFLGADVIGTLPLDRTISQLPGMDGLKPADAALASADDNQNGDHRKGYYGSASGYEESVRTIRNTILLSDFERRLRSIVLTSAEPGEGKSTLAVHLAIANAAHGKKTLLVDADLRRPSIHAKFNLNPREGLSDVLSGNKAWQDVVIQVEGRPHLGILPSGPGSHRAADLIGPRLGELLDEFAKEYHLVILDSPPLLGFAECLQMAAVADGVLIITRAGKTKRKAVAAVVSALQRVRANVVGVVLNQVSRTTSADGYSYYGRDHYEHYGTSE